MLPKRLTPNLVKIRLELAELFHCTETGTNVAGTNVPVTVPILITNPQEKKNEFCKTSSRHCSLKSEFDLASWQAGAAV